MSSLVNRREHGQIALQNCIYSALRISNRENEPDLRLAAQRTKQQAHVIRPRCSARRTVGENDAASVGEDSSKTATAISTVRTAQSIGDKRRLCPAAVRCSLRVAATGDTKVSKFCFEV